MKNCWFPLTVFLLSILATGLQAHPLSQEQSQSTRPSITDQLISEDPVKLVASARKQGDVVRGAILFHQGNINCAKCHRPTAEKERIGPDLSRIEQDVSDQYLVESILQPSKSIKKGYEPVVVLTDEGQQLTGLVVAENENTLVLRSSEDPDRVITLERSSIEEIRAGKKSTMPEGLANELKNRQQFLDLIRYVIDIKERGPTGQPVNAALENRQLSPELRGLIALQELNCISCHEPAAEKGLVAKQAPNLGWSARVLNPDHLARFIADPQKTKPGTTMPHLLGGLESTEKLRAANAITHFLATKFQNEFEFQSVDRSSVARGQQLFDSVGCVACHAPRNASAVEIPMAGSQPLGDVSEKYSVTALVAFLEDPLMARPSGRMPNLRLTHSEASDLANFLLQSENPSEAGASTTEPNDALFNLGQSLVRKHQCAACHTELQEPENQSRVQIALENLDRDKGCLSATAGAWPKFDLEPQQVSEIRAALADFPMEVSNEQKIQISMQTFNCHACHDRNGFGGITPERNSHFQTTNLNLGDQGRIPPTLSGVGAKLKPKWMRDVMVNGRVIRPYMNTRMPQFGESNVGHLIQLLQNEDVLEQSKFAAFDDQKTMREFGLKLAGNQGLNCVACHTYKYNLSDTMPAVDLTEMAERLKKDWFYQYMLEPQKFSPNTVMPSFWPSGVAIRKDIEGAPEYQIEALWQYLIDGRQAGTPRGVVREPLEIVVDEEAQILRRSYPGIGKRGIGVGYPGGVNLAYDAEQMRLAMVWRGKFVDPGGVWTGQGSGNVRPMGKPFDFPKGPELDRSESPWVVDDGRPPNHRFKGYSLDASRRPTFRYDFGDVNVEDFFTSVQIPSSPDLQLSREISFVPLTDQSDLAFRIVSGGEKSIRLIEDDRQSFLVNGQLRVRVDPDHQAEIAELPSGQEIRVKLNLKANQRQTLKIYYLIGS